jgi:hypothetical protein
MADNDPRPDAAPHDDVLPDADKDPAAEAGNPGTDEHAEFDQGWDLEDGAATDPNPEADDPDPDDPEQATPPEEGEAQPQGATEAKGDSPKESEPARDDADKAPKPEDVERIKQELKTWQGRARKAREEAEAAERELEAKRQAAKGKDTPTESDEQRQSRERVESALSEEDRQFLESAKTDYPDVYRMAELVARQMGGGDLDSRINRAVDQIRSERIDPALAKVQTATQEAHIAEITRAHADVGELVESGALQEWIETQPYTRAREYLEIYERGSAAQVVQLIDQFKQSRQPPDPTPNPDPKLDPKRQQQLAAGATVRPRSGGPPKTSTKDDWDAGWDLG